MKIRKAWLVITFVGLLITACGRVETPFPTIVVLMPTPTPAPTATARPTPTPELLPYTVYLLEGDPYICPEQKIYEGQPIVINYEFRFPRRHDVNLATWFAKAGVVLVTIDKSVTTIRDPEFWSKVETKKEKDGTFYYTTFRAPFPSLPAGTHKIVTEYSVPELQKSYFYRHCTTLVVLPR